MMDIEMPLPISTQEIVAVSDYTSLKDTDTSASIIELCEVANKQKTAVGGICIFPQFVKTVKANLTHTSSKIVTVCNFPLGNEPTAVMAESIRTAIEAGADEIDIVIPYRSLMAGDEDSTLNIVKAARESCGDKVLKVILETGILQNPALIRKASELAIAGGADFLKTSTGKVAINATLDASSVMLDVIAGHKASTGKKVGFKAAGGIRSQDAAKAYMQLAADIMGSEYVQPATFRLGTSSLLIEGAESVDY